MLESAESVENKTKQGIKDIQYRQQWNNIVVADSRYDDVRVSDNFKSLF